MAEVKVYEKRSCSTCRELAMLLRARGVPFDRIDYYEHPLPEAKISELIARAGIRPADALRTDEPLCAELGLELADVDDAEIIRLMAAHPQLLQRPFVERGERVVLARPVERVLELLDGQ
jgi:arsenate reductase